MAKKTTLEAFQELDRALRKLGRELWNELAIKRKRFFEIWLVVEIILLVLWMIEKGI